LRRPAAFCGCCACGALVGRNPSHQAACDHFAAEDLAFCSKPVCIGIAGGDLRTSPKKAFGGAFEESLYKIAGNSHIQQPTYQVVVSKDLRTGLPLQTLHAKDINVEMRTIAVLLSSPATSKKKWKSSQASKLRPQQSPVRPKLQYSDVISANVASTFGFATTFTDTSDTVFMGITGDSGNYRNCSRSSDSLVTRTKAGYYVGGVAFTGTCG
jgi:hypothetical protein